MSFNSQGVTVHPNRVFVKELPVDVDRDELKAAFSGFGLRIRTARVVETKGSTNYGFLTLESKSEADQVIQMARSDHGILIRGKKILVDQAFSRRNPLRRNSRQFTQAFQGIFDSVGAAVNAGTDGQHHFVRPDSHYAYDMAQSHGRGCGTNQMQYPFNPSWQNPVYIPTASQGLAAQDTHVNRHAQYPHGVHPDRPAFIDNGHQSTHWPLLPGHYAYDSADYQHQHYGASHPSYMQPHHPGLHGQLFVETPNEGQVAPHGTEWSPHTESATTERPVPGASPTYTHHDQEMSQQMQSQLQHHTQLVQQHLTQQQNLANAQWVQYAQYQQSVSLRRDSDSSNN